MSTIMNKLIPNRKVQIELIRDDFSSAILGNIWVGRVVTLNIATASNFVKLGYAKFVDEADDNPLAKPDESSRVTPPANTPPAAQENSDGQKAPMTLEEALDNLNTEDDSHWTKGGLPDLTVLKEWTGEHVQRKDIDAVRPDFNRENAAE